MRNGALRALGAAMAMMVAVGAGAVGAPGQKQAPAHGAPGTHGPRAAQAPAPRAPDPAPVPAALQTLEAGQWELRGREGDADVRKLCVTDLRQLLQVQHGRGLCRSYTVSDSPHALTVTYDCSAAGNGRTDIRVETTRLVQIRSQGIADGAPFEFAAEGRRIGSCES